MKKAKQKQKMSSRELANALGAKRVGKLPKHLKRFYYAPSNLLELVVELDRNKKKFKNKKLKKP